MKSFSKQIVMAMSVTVLNQCVLKTPEQTNSNDVMCGGVDITQSGNCFELKVTKTIVTTSYAASVTTLNSYFQTSDTCFRNSDGTFVAGVSQPVKTVCQLVPSIEKTTKLSQVQVNFNANCPGEGTLVGNTFTWFTPPATGLCNFSTSTIDGFGNQIENSDTSIAKPFDFEVRIPDGGGGQYQNFKINVVQGQGTQANVRVNALSSPAQPVTLSVSGQPSGVTTTLGTPSGTPMFFSTLNITAAGATTPGQYTLTITGTSGSTTQTATIALEVRTDIAAYPLGGYNWRMGSAGVNCTAVCAFYGLTCNQAGIDAYRTDSTCALAQHFIGLGDFGCEFADTQCGSGNAYCYSPGYVEETTVRRTFYYSYAQTCNSAADIRVIPFCPCQ